MDNFKPTWDFKHDGRYPSVLIGSGRAINSGLDVVIGGGYTEKSRQGADSIQSNRYGRLAGYAAFTFARVDCLYSRLTFPGRETK